MKKTNNKSQSFAKRGLSHAKRGLSHAKRGFTLIELLIVIVIIGILAVLVLSTINPIEQRNKATDTALRSTSAELLNGIERYYASNGVYPWGSQPAPDDVIVDSSEAWFVELVDSNEVKPEFADRDDFDSLKIFYEQSNSLVKICFIPKSTQFKKNYMKFTLAGVNVGLGGTNAEMVCVPE